MANASRKRQRLRWIAVFSTLVAGLACSSAPKPNVVLIVVDTLRRDHLGSYGAARRTPAIDTLAKDAIRFDSAYATAPWTQPSIASILTGLYPSRHGLKTPARLPDESRTIAEILSEHGYATGAIVSHTLLARNFGFNQGFDHWDQTEAVQPVRRRSSSGVTRKAQQMLRKMGEQERPFFLFVHYFDPHYEYLRHPRFGFAASHAGRLDGTQGIDEVRSMGYLTPDEISFLQDLYDEEVLHTDASLGELLAELRKLNLYDDALIIVTADHGEEFLERGWLGHTRSLYDELVRVPLVIRPPGGVSRPLSVQPVISHVSLVPTLLDYAAIDAEPFGVQGPSLRPLMLGQSPEPMSALVEVDFVPLRPERLITKTHKKGLISQRHKLIRDDQSGEIELYDLESDPLERHDLSNREKELTKYLLTQLESKLAATRQDAAETETVKFSEEQIQELQALGYVDR